MSEAHVLLVEDESKIAAAVRDYLVAAGFTVSIREGGVGTADWVRQQRPDAVLLDIMLPGEDGLSVLRAIRRFSDVPVLMLTARVEEIDRLLGLEFGADDYLCKPFSPRELVARLRAVLRRARGQLVADAPSPVQLDLDRLEARVHGEPLALTPVEFRLLRKLLEKPGKIYSRAQLQAVIYDDHRVVSERTVDSHVRNLRRKFDERGLPEAIVAVYGAGFRFDWAPAE